MLSAWTPGCECTCPIPDPCYCPDLLGVTLDLGGGETIDLARPVSMPCSWSFKSVVQIPLFTDSYTSDWGYFKLRHTRTSVYRQSRTSKDFDYRMTATIEGSVQLGIFSPAVSVKLRITTTFGSFSPKQVKEDFWQIDDVVEAYGCFAELNPVACEDGVGTSTPFPLDPGTCEIETTYPVSVGIVTLEPDGIPSSQTNGPNWNSGYSVGTSPIQFECDSSATLDNPLGTSMEELSIHYDVTRNAVCYYFDPDEFPWDFQGKRVVMDSFDHNIPIPAPWQLSSMTVSGYYV